MGQSIGARSRSQVDRVRQLVLQRDHHRCLASGAGAVAGRCSGPLTMQHAVGRGMGGSALVAGPQFLRTFCLAHNVREAAHAGFAQLCRDSGWSVPRATLDLQAAILQVPVRYPDRTWWRLDAAGGRDECWPDVPASWADGPLAPASGPLDPIWG